MIVDYFTKVAEFVPIASKEPFVIARVFWDHWICRYGVPLAVTTDNANEFEVDFAHMLSRLGVHHIKTAVAHPSANGAVERLNKSIKTILKAHLNDNPTHWKAA